MADLDVLRDQVQSKYGTTFDTSFVDHNLEEGDYIEVKFIDLDFDDETHYSLPENEPIQSFGIRIDKFSCETYSDYATKAIAENGYQGKKTYVESNGVVSIGAYIEGIWIDIGL